MQHILALIEPNFHSVKKKAILRSSIEVLCGSSVACNRKEALPVSIVQLCAKQLIIVLLADPR